MNTYDDENPAAIRLYLNKLQGMVPNCPKNHTLPGLEVLQHTINYIGDLRDTLSDSSDTDTPPVSPVERMSFNDAFSRPSSYHRFGAPSRETQYREERGFPPPSTFRDSYSCDNYGGYGAAYSQDDMNGGYNSSPVDDCRAVPTSYDPSFPRKYESYTDSYGATYGQDYSEDYRQGYNSDYHPSR